MNFLNVFPLQSWTNTISYSIFSMGTGSVPVWQDRVSIAKDCHRCIWKAQCSGNCIGVHFRPVQDTFEKYLGTDTF